MSDQADTLESSITNLGRYTKLLCLGVIALSVLSCIGMAASRSVGLTRVTITALDKTAEPRDHNIPLLKQNDALPDYRVTVNTTNRLRIELGAKPNESAVAGLTWELPKPISTSDVASIRLDDQDKMLSDAFAEVQLTSNSVTAGNYRFDFAMERSLSVGIESFFKTPIGMAIAAAFTIAVLLIIFSLFAGILGNHAMHPSRRSAANSNHSFLAATRVIAAVLSSKHSV